MSLARPATRATSMARPPNDSTALVAASSQLSALATWIRSFAMQAPRTTSRISGLLRPSTYGAASLFARSCAAASGICSCGTGSLGPISGTRMWSNGGSGIGNLGLTRGIRMWSNSQGGTGGLGIFGMYATSTTGSERSSLSSLKGTGLVKLGLTLIVDLFSVVLRCFWATPVAASGSGIGPRGPTA
jgi:hypothetical protein